MVGSVRAPGIPRPPVALRMVLGTVAVVTVRVWSG